MWLFIKGRLTCQYDTHDRLFGQFGPCGSRHCAVTEVTQVQCAQPTLKTCLTAQSKASVNVK